MALKTAHVVRPEGKFTEKDGTLSEGEGKILADTLNILVDRTGGPNFQMIRIPSYAKADLPSAVNIGIIFVTDDVGGAVLAFSDGSDWRRSTDRAIIS